MGAVWGKEEYEEPEPGRRMARVACSLWSADDRDLAPQRFFSTDYRLARTFEGWKSYRYGYLLWLQKELESAGEKVCVFVDEAPEQHWAAQTLASSIDMLRPIEFVAKRLPVVKPHEPIYLDKSDGDRLMWTRVFTEKVGKCYQGGVRFMIGLIQIRWGGDRLGEAHDNALVIDFKKKSITRYEPNGGLVTEELGWYPGDEFDDALRDLFFDVIFPKIGIDYRGWRLNSTNEMCARPVKSVGSTGWGKVGPQDAEGGVDKFNLQGEAEGYCAAWSMLFLHYRIMHPELSNEMAARKFATDYTPEELALMIRQYAAFIASKKNELDRHFYRFEIK